jgi:DNA-binding MarR family transcriptional regulator
MSAKYYTLDSYVIDTLMRDLVGHDRRPSAFLIYITLASSAGDGQLLRLSHVQLAERTGLSKRCVQDAVDHLVARKFLRRSKSGATEVATCEVLNPWRPSKD